MSAWGVPPGPESRTGVTRPNPGPGTAHPQAPGQATSLQNEGGATEPPPETGEMVFPGSDFKAS